MACERVACDLGGYELQCNEVSCQWDKGGIKRWDFEKDYLMVTIPFGVGICFQSIIANSDDLFFGFVDRNPLVFELFEFR